MSTFILIPGAGADPRVYAATIVELRGRGHDALAPPLPLADPDATPADLAEAALAALAKQPAKPGAAGRLVIVGHSLGAFAATIAAARAGAAELVLLAPMIPTPGESADGWSENTGHPEAIAGLVKRFGPPDEWGEAALEEVFYHDLDEAAKRVSAECSAPSGPALFAEPLPLDSWPDASTIVLAPREDRLFPLDFQRRVARERLGLEVEEIGGGHLSMLSRPEELARRLSELTEP